MHESLGTQILRFAQDDTVEVRHMSHLMLIVQNHDRVPTKGVVYAFFVPHPTSRTLTG